MANSLEQDLREAQSHYQDFLDDEVSNIVMTCHSTCVPRLPS